MRSSSFVLLFLASILVCLLSASCVSADGSIQPFQDEYCSDPSGNITLIPIVSSPQCQWVTANDMLISFSYQCNSYSNFSLAFYVNASVKCAGSPDWSVTSTSLSNGCSVATFDDPNNHVLFYAQFQCAASWPSDSNLIEGVDKLRQVASSEAQKAQSIPQLSGLMSHVKHSALSKLVRQMQKEQ